MARIRRVDERLSLEVAWCADRPAIGQDYLYLKHNLTFVHMSYRLYQEAAANFYVSRLRAVKPHPACSFAADCSEDDGDHAAGSPACGEVEGYNGWRITAQEMNLMTRLQCLIRRQDLPEYDPDFEWEGSEFEDPNVFVTEVSETTPVFGKIEGIYNRHGIGGELYLANRDSGGDCYTPVHPPCADVYRRVSMSLRQRVDFGVLLKLRSKIDMYEFPRWPHVYQPTDKEEWEHIPGQEYLAADPYTIPRLDELFERCAVSPDEVVDSMSSKVDELILDGRSLSCASNPVEKSPARIQDPFLTLPNEIIDNIIELISKDDLYAVGNLRLCSPAFRHLSQSFFRNQVLNHMPWIWEVQDLINRQIAMDWKKLFTELARADGGKKASSMRLTTKPTSVSLYGNLFEIPKPSKAEIQDDAYSDRKDSDQVDDKDELAYYYFLQKHTNRAHYWTPCKELHEKVVGKDDEEWSKVVNACVPTDSQTILGLKNRRRVWGDCVRIFEAVEKFEARS